MHESDLRHSNARLQDKLQAIYDLRRTRSKVNWDRDLYAQLLAHFDNPHLSLPPIIHVAGTNGKGSVVAILRSVLEAQGYRVHAYTSPHLMHVNERIVLAGEEIDDAYLEVLIDRAMDFIGDKPMSFFEVITAIAFKAFSEVQADVVLLEVGLGGRLDCTNIFEAAPLVSIINRISMDHTDFLGETIEQIAREKGGIMRKDVPCVVGYQGSGAQKDAIDGVLRDCARESGARLFVFGDDYSAEQESDGFSLVYAGVQRSYPLPSLHGVHQIYNAALSLMALNAIKDALPVSDEAIEAGLKNVRWRARLQPLDSQRLGLPDHVKVWLDGGHNDSAAEAIAQFFHARHGEGEAKTHVIMGMLKTKDVNRFLTHLWPCVAALSLVPISSEPVSVRATDIDFAALGRDVPVRSALTFEDALAPYKQADEPTDILICGSVYLAGEVLGTL